MKIRTDFVTNSSSSSFSVIISVETKDGKNVSFEESPWEYDMDSGGCVDFNENLSNLLTGKTKKLKSKYSDVEELAKYLMDAVSDDLCDCCYWEDEELEDDEEEFDEEDEEYCEDFGQLSPSAMMKVVDERKTNFVEELVKIVNTVDDISKITVRREYSAWGEFADLIPDNDEPLCELAEKVLATSGEEQKKALDEMREYIHTPQSENRQGENFASNFDDIRYVWEGDDEALIALAQRLCSGFAADDASEGVEIEELNLETKEHSKYAEFVLC